MANYFCCIQTFSFKLLICSQTFIKPKHVQKPEILYEFDIRFHTKVRKFNNSCFTNCTKHALDLYTNKTNRIDRHKPIITELGQDETLTVAYNFRETKSCNHFFLLFGRKDCGEILASACVTRGQKLWSPETLPYRNVYPTSFLLCYGKAVNLLHMWNFRVE